LQITTKSRYINGSLGIDFMCCRFVLLAIIDVENSRCVDDGSGFYRFENLFEIIEICQIDLNRVDALNI
jgi:hypothetical protein